MSAKLKKYGIKFLLLLLDALKTVGRVIRLLLRALSVPFALLWKLIVRRLVFLIYRLLLRAKLVAGGTLPPVRRRFFAVFSHRYVVHIAIAVIAVFVVTSNLYAHGTDLGQASAQSMFNSLVNVEPSDYSSPDSSDVNAESQLNRVPVDGSATGSNPVTPLVIEIEPYLYDQSGVLKPHSLPGTDVGSELSDTGEAPVSASEPKTYTIENGDTISGIAQKFGISVNTVLWANGMTARSLLKVGRTLTILPVSGVLHTVKKGETLGGIAKRYGADLDEVLAANRIASAGQIRIGQNLIVPGGQPPAPVIRQVAPTPPSTLGNVRDVFLPPPTGVVGQGAEAGRLAWPTDQHLINQYFHNGHPGIDINGNLSNHTYAADDGIVTYAGWNSGGYGNMILIDHGNGMITRYGHHSKLYVKVGDQVTKGQVIGQIGSTGHSTGPHLHFELYVNGKRANPLSYYR